MSYPSWQGLGVESPFWKKWSRTPNPYTTGVGIGVRVGVRVWVGGGGGGGVGDGGGVRPQGLHVFQYDGRSSSHSIQRPSLSWGVGFPIHH